MEAGGQRRAGAGRGVRVATAPQRTLARELPHKAVSYAGARDRIVVSFSAQSRASEGEQLFPCAGT